MSQYQISFLTMEEAETKKKQENYIICNIFERQLKELVFIEKPELRGEKKNPSFFESDGYQTYTNQKTEKMYICFPWLRTIVVSVPGSDYFVLRTNRNRGLIDSELQQKLYSLKIAVLGLSVGSNIAHSLNISGIGSSFVLADFDELDTTNLNRLQADIQHIGLNKGVIAAQKILQLNPFASVKVLENGITSSALEELLSKELIDIIVEEVDNMSVKMDVRVLARKYKKPVLMVTDNGSGVVLQIDRYDLGYANIFGKTEEYWREKIKNIKSPKDVGDMIISFIGGHKFTDPAMLDAADLVMSGQLASWPQLGISAQYGGVVTANAIKKIVSGSDQRPNAIEHYPL